MGINSKYNHIQNHTQLMYTIMQLNLSRAEQEEEIKYKLKEIYFSFQPMTFLKNVISNKIHDPKVQKTIGKSALALGTNFLISKVFRRAGIQGYLLSLVMEKVASYAMNGKSNLITKGVEKLSGLIKKFK